MRASMEFGFIVFVLAAVMKESFFRWRIQRFGIFLIRLFDYYFVTSGS